MSQILDLDEIRWDRYPAIAAEPRARKWIETQALLGLARNTVEAYARALQDLLLYCEDKGIKCEDATQEDIARYVGDLRQRPGLSASKVLHLDSGAGLANATLQQRLTAVRLFFDHLIEDGLREDNPVGRGRYTPGKAFASRSERGIVPRLTKLPWIPSDEQWRTFLEEAKQEPIRNRCMIGLAYDAGLRREELCLLRSDDLDPAHRLLRIRAETTKGRHERIVPYSAASGDLLRAYLDHRHRLSQARGLLFLSESPRNRTKPITLWTWSKVIRAIALRANLPQFSTHTLRHLCLTDLARSGWDLHEIAAFAGHRNLATTQQYINLSGRDLAEKLARSMEHIHAWRAAQLAEEVGGVP